MHLNALLRMPHVVTRLVKIDKVRCECTFVCAVDSGEDFDDGMAPDPDLEFGWEEKRWNVIWSCVDGLDGFGR